MAYWSALPSPQKGKQPRQSLGPVQCHRLIANRWGHCGRGVGQQGEGDVLLEGLPHGRTRRRLRFSFSVGLGRLASHIARLQSKAHQQAQRQHPHACTCRASIQLTKRFRKHREGGDGRAACGALLRRGRLTNTDLQWATMGSVAWQPLRCADTGGRGRLGVNGQSGLTSSQSTPQACTVALAGNAKGEKCLPVD